MTTASEASWPLRLLYVHAAEGCNLACRHCWIQPVEPGAVDAGRFLPLQELADAVEQARPLGLEAVKLTGGEPLLHPKILDIIGVLRQKGLKCSVETNGTLVTAEVAAALAASPAAEVTVSLDGADAATHEWVRRVPGCFAAALAGMERLSAAGLRPEVVFTVMRRNREQLEAVVDLARNLGAGAVKINVLQPLGRGRELWAAGEALTIRELVALGRWAEQELAPRSFAPLFFHQPAAFRPLSRIFGGTAPGCGACGILGILGLLADGSYALCGIGQTVPGLVFGQVRHTPLRQVWEQSPCLAELRQGLPRRLSGVCGLCLMQELCLGGCVAQTYEATGSFWEPFWFCRQAREAGLFPPGRLLDGTVEG